MIDDVLPPFDFPEDALPGAVIDVSEIDLPVVTRTAIAALEQANNPPRLFRQSDYVVRVDHDEDGRPIIKRVGISHMKQAMANAARWCKERPKIGQVSVAPPRDVVEDVLATAELPFPGLRGIVRTPYFAVDGELVVAPGYNPRTRLFLAADRDLVLPVISTRPRAEDVSAAVALLRDLLVDFPFVSDADRAHAFAAMLLPFARDLVRGPTPFHLIDAPAHGSGKSLLLKVVLHPACGEVDFQAIGRGEDEMAKLVLSVLLKGKSAHVFDNIAGKVDSPTLASLLTAEHWNGRILGASQMVSIANRTVWCATMNNASLSTELARRSVMCRLDANSERPFERTGFKYPDLARHVSESRSAIVAACLTIIQSWVAADKPLATRTLGSFEAWAAVMGGILAHAGITGLLENTERVFDTVDDDGIIHRAFVTAWFEKFGEDNVRSTDLRETAVECGMRLGRSSAEPDQVRAIGAWLKNKRDNVFASFRIERRTLSRGSQTWGLMPVGDSASGGHGGHGWSILPHSYRKLEEHIRGSGNRPTTPTTPTTSGVDRPMDRSIIDIGAVEEPAHPRSVIPDREIPARQLPKVCGFPIGASGADCLRCGFPPQEHVA